MAAAQEVIEPLDVVVGNSARVVGEAGVPGKVRSIGKLRSMVREVLAGELGEIDGWVEDYCTPLNDEKSNLDKERSSVIESQKEQPSCQIVYRAAPSSCMASGIPGLA